MGVGAGAERVRESGAVGDRGARVRDLAQLSNRGVARNIAYLVSVWAVIVAALTVAAHQPRWWVIAAAIVVVASRQQALLNIEHDCVHGSFLRGKRRNEFVGAALAASPVGSPYRSGRARHLAHHRLLTRDSDPDGELHKGDDKRTARGLFTYFAKGLSGGYALKVLLKSGDHEAVSVDVGDARHDRRSLIAGQVVLASTATLTLGWWVYPVLWLLPLGTLTAFCHLLRNYAEHALLPNEENLHPSRLITVRSNRVEAALVAPFNMNYHAEHHLYPFVPARRLPELQRRLDGDATAPARLVRPGYLRTLATHLRQLP